MSNDDKKITVRLILPMSGISHDIRVPDNLRVKDFLPSAVELLKSTHKEALLLSARPTLCRSQDARQLIQLDMTLSALGVKDGDILYLV